MHRLAGLCLVLLSGLTSIALGQIASDQVVEVRTRDSAQDSIVTAMLAELELREFEHSSRFRTAVATALGGTMSGAVRAARPAMTLAVEAEYAARARALDASLSAVVEQRLQARARGRSLVAANDAVAEGRTRFSRELAALEALDVERISASAAARALDEAIRTGTHPQLVAVRAIARDHNVHLEAGRQAQSLARQRYAEDVKAFAEWQKTRAAALAASAASAADRDAFVAAQRRRHADLQAARAALLAEQQRSTAALVQETARVEALQRDAKAAVEREQRQIIEHADLTHRTLVRQFGTDSRRLHELGSRWLTGDGRAEPELAGLLADAGGGSPGFQRRQSMEQAYRQVVEATALRAEQMRGPDPESRGPAAEAATRAWAAHEASRLALQTLAADQQRAFDTDLAKLGSSPLARLARLRMRILEGEYAVVRSMLLGEAHDAAKLDALKARFDLAAAGLDGVERSVLAQADGFSESLGAAAEPAPDPARRYRSRRWSGLTESVWERWGRKVPDAPGWFLLPSGIVERD